MPQVSHSLEVPERGCSLYVTLCDVMGGAGVLVDAHKGKKHESTYPDG
jgi:hypothetical protein